MGTGHAELGEDVADFFGDPAAMARAEQRGRGWVWDAREMSGTETAD